MPLKRLAQIVILASLCIVLRFAFASFPNVKPISAIFFVSIFYIGLIDSLWVMSLTMFGSSFLLGFGFVVWWQIASFGILLLLWRYFVLSYIKSVVIQSLLAGFLMLGYGALISLPLSIQFQTDFWLYWINGIAFDLAHAISTVLFYPIVYNIFRRTYPHEKIYS